MRLAMEPAHVKKPTPPKAPAKVSAPKAPVRVSTPRSSYTSNVASRISTPRPAAPKPVVKAAPKPAPKPAPVVKAAPTAKAAIKIPAPTEQFTPMVPSVDEFLAGDTTFQDQEAQLRRAYAEFMANQQLDQGNYETSYASQLRDLGKAKETGFQDLENDFAGRGLLKSGLYADAYSGLQDQFNDRQTALDTARAQYLAGLNQAAAGFQNDQNTTLTSAKQEAIARRAAKFNLGV